MQFFKAKGSSHRPEQPDEIVIADGGGYAFYLHVRHIPAFVIIQIHERKNHHFEIKWVKERKRRDFLHG